MLAGAKRRILVTRRFAAAVQETDAKWKRNTFPLWTGEKCGAQLAPLPSRAKETRGETQAKRNAPERLAPVEAAVTDPDIPCRNHDFAS